MPQTRSPNGFQKKQAMKKKQKFLFQSVFLILSLIAGIYLGRYFFETKVPVGYISRYPQQFMNSTFKASGIVSRNKIGIGSLLKIYWLCDENTGDCMPVKTNRSILPEASVPLTIKVRLTEPLTTPWGGQFLLIEEEEGMKLPFVK